MERGFDVDLVEERSATDFAGVPCNRVHGDVRHRVIVAVDVIVDAASRGR